MKRDIKLNRFYPHPPERVWRALTDPEALASWFADSDFKPVVGHKFTFTTDPGPTYDGILYCEVIEVDEPHHLAYTFRGGVMKSITTVTWILTPEAGGTRLRLEHTGFTGLRDIAISGIIGLGWRHNLSQMPAVLDSLASDERIVSE